MRKSTAELSKIVREVSSEVVVIGCHVEDEADFPLDVDIVDIGVQLHYVAERRSRALSIVEWIAKWTLVQLNIAIDVLLRRKDLDIVLFYMTFPHHLPTLILSRFLGLRTVEIITRSRGKSPGPFGRFENALNRLDFTLLDRISLESSSIAQSLPIKSFEDKFTAFGARYVDAARYRVETEFRRRSNCVGFLGRLTPEKGILTFLEAIPLMLRKESESGLSDTSFMIGGSGPLDRSVEKEIEKINREFGARAVYVGWIDEQDVPLFLNKTRVLVLPTTHSEGLPNIILEAMACGSVVLAPPVGGISDLIIDGKTGFLLHSLDAASLSDAVIRALRSEHVEDVSQNASASVAIVYTFENSVCRFRRIVNDALDCRRTLR